MPLRNENGAFASKDRTGERHGFYEVQYCTGEKDSSGAYIWVALCDCGNSFKVAASRMNRVKSCGCKNKKPDWKRKSQNFAGTVVRSIEAVEKTDKHNNGYIVWKAKCLLCGKENEFPSYYFTRNHVRCECEAWKEKYSEMVGRKPLPNNQAHVNMLYSSYKRAAQERSLYFNLTMDEFRQFVESDCHYCGASPSVTYTSRNLAGEYAWNGIDRVDNTKGYEKENCVPCCSMCNLAKSSHSKEDFLNWVKRVYDHSIKEEVMP